MLLFFVFLNFNLNATVLAKDAQPLSSLEDLTVEELKQENSKFQAGTLIFSSINQTQESFDALVNFYNNEAKRHDSYQPENGEAEEFAKKRQNLWGNRAKERNGLRAFVVTDAETSNPLGYINIGVANIPFIAGANLPFSGDFDNLLEGGIKFPAAQSATIATVMNVVFGTWPAKMFSTFSNKTEKIAPVFIYTVSPDAHLVPAFDLSNLTKLDLHSDDAIHKTVKKNLLEDDRFKLISEEEPHLILEGSKQNKKLVYFKLLLTSSN